MVSTLTYASAAIAGAIAVLSTITDAHQRVIIPAPTFTDSNRDVNWRPLAYLESQGVPVGNDVNGYLKSKGVKNLREYMDNKANYKVNVGGATFDCGFTNPNGARQPVPSNGMMRSTGYAHEGPCEIWIDDVMVKHGDNCFHDIGSKTVSYKIDFSSCKGDCMIRWYWLGNRLIGGKKRSWQVYKECIPIKGSGGGRSSSTKPSSTANSTDSVGADNDDDDGSNKAGMLPLPAAEPTINGDASRCKVMRN